MIAKSVGDLLHGVYAPPERVPATAAAAAHPASAQLVEPAAAGRTVLRLEAATRRTRIGVVDSHIHAHAHAHVHVYGRAIFGRRREILAGLLLDQHLLLLLVLVLVLFPSRQTTANIVVTVVVAPHAHVDARIRPGVHRRP